MNRQWMYNGDRQTPEYITGLHNFISVAQANSQNGFMCYPCVHCENKKDHSSSKTIHLHLLRYGFMPNYNCWTKHGEIMVMMEDSGEEEDDDNYPMFPEYGDTARGNLKKKTHQMISPCCEMMIFVRSLLMHIGKQKNPMRS